MLFRSAECTQQWAHVDASMKPSRADPSLSEAFPRDDLRSPLVDLDPIQTPFEGATRSFSFTAWQTAMDPLGHANHPDYLAWCDEGLARAAVDAGRDPHSMRPVCERVYFKGGVLAGDLVTVETRMVGRTAGGDSVLRHQVGRFAKALTVRAGDLSQLF